MKSRTGFVSNSSSSSFILVFKKLPTSYEELLEMMDISPSKARVIWKDLQAATPATDDTIADALASGYAFKPNLTPSMFFHDDDYIVPYDSISNRHRAERKALEDKIGYDPMNNAPVTDEMHAKLSAQWADHRAESDSLVIQAAAEWLESIKEHIAAGRVFVLSYEDHTEIGAKIEHDEDTFSNINHIRISNH